jgi:hypothetical protein
MDTPHIGLAAVRAAWLTAIPLAGLLAGCATPAGSGSGSGSTGRLYTRQELENAITRASAIGREQGQKTSETKHAADMAQAAQRLQAAQQAAAKRIVAERQDYERKLQAEREGCDKRYANAVKAAREAGRQEGDKAATARLEAEKRAAEAASAKQGDSTLNEYKQAVAAPLLPRRLADDKAAELLARHVLEQTMAQLDRTGFEVLLAIPSKEMKSLQQFGEAKVFNAVSPVFQRNFGANFARMTVQDGLDLLNKLYGFNAWVAHGAKRVWLGLPAAPPRADPTTRMELFFEERKFGGE